MLEIVTEKRIMCEDFDLGRKLRRKSKALYRIVIFGISIALVATVAVIIWKNREYAAGAEFYNNLRSIGGN